MYLYSTCPTKHPSRNVMNCRHLLGCDTIDVFKVREKEYFSDPSLRDMG